MPGQVGTADLLVEGALVVTMDPERRIFSDGAVAIEGGRIVGVGKSSDVLSSFQPKRRILGKGKVLIPGLINAHSHFPPFVTGAIPEGYSSETIRRNLLYPLFEGLSHEEEVIGAKARMLEMIRTGTTCFADGGSKHLGHVIQAVEEIGLRGVLGRWRCDSTENGSASEPNHAVRADTIEVLEELEEDFRKQGQISDRIKIAATLVDERLASDELLQGATELVDKYKTILSVDVAVTREATNETMRRKGLRPVQRMKDIGVLRKEVLLNHATDLDSGDVSAIAETGAGVCWTPSAALRRGHGTTQTGMVPELLKAGASVGLGTDGPASSDYADMVRVMYLAATLPVDSRISHSASSSEAALEMGTIHGARSLGLEGEIGSLEVGKRADLVLFNTERPEWRPLFHVVNNLVYSASGDSVHTVIVDGRVLLDEGELKVSDAADILKAAKQLKERMVEQIVQSAP